MGHIEPLCAVKGPLSGRLPRLQGALAGVSARVWPAASKRCATEVIRGNQGALSGRRTSSSSATSTRRDGPKKIVTASREHSPPGDLPEFPHSTISPPGSRGLEPLAAFTPAPVSHPRRASQRRDRPGSTPGGCRHSHAFDPARALFFPMRPTALFADVTLSEAVDQDIEGPLQHIPMLTH